MTTILGPVEYDSGTENLVGERLVARAEDLGEPA
jgi:hypothetical protein